VAPDIKELENKIGSLPDGKEKMEHLIRFSLEMHNSDIDGAVKAGIQALDIARKLIDHSGIVNSVHLLETLFYKSSYPENFEELLIEAIRLSEYINDNTLKVKLYSAAGRYYDIINKKVVSLQYFFKGKEVLSVDETIELHYAAGLYMSLGNLYFKLNEFENSVEYYQKTLACIDKGDHKKRAIVNSNIAMSYAHVGNHDLAIEFLYKSIDIQTSLKEETYLVSDHNNIAGIFFLKGDFAKAAEHYSISIEINKQKNLNRIVDSYFGLAECFFALNQPQKVIEILEKAEAISIQPALNNYLCFEISSMFAKALSAIEDYKTAFKYSERACNLLLESERNGYSHQSVPPILTQSVPPILIQTQPLTS